MLDFTEDFVIDAAFVAEADGGFAFETEEFAEDFAVAGEFLVAHAVVVRVFLAHAGEAAGVAAGEVVVDGGKVFEVLAAGAFQMR